MIALVGPGGSGKSTCGSLLAAELGSVFVDLDHEFLSRIGHIGKHIDSHGYASYARSNVLLYLAIKSELSDDDVIALSSGFFCYNEDVDQGYGPAKDELLKHPHTYCILAAHDFERCVVETVRRQMSRPYLDTSANRQREIIRARFRIYGSLPVRHVENASAPVNAVKVIRSDIRGDKPLQATSLQTSD